MHHVIIGAGPAGVIAAETLHRLQGDSKVTVVGDEPEPPYSRMAIPYLLNDKIQEPGTYLRKDADHYAEQNTEVVRDRVTSIDTKDRVISLAGGGSLNYGKLLIATGSHPVSPPIPGIDSAGVHACWTLDDARAIMNLAKPGANVVLMGAGFIGCIILEALASRGVNLTVVEMENRMVPRMLDETAGTLLKQWCESKGVSVHTSTRVTGIEAAGGGLSVSLDKGNTLDAALVIAATGVAPNTQFLDGSGIEVDHGILVDSHLQTNVAHVYAAGDVAQGRDFSTGEFSVQAIQPTAADHGRIAATNMAGDNVLEHPGSVNMNVLDTLGLVSSSFGMWMGVDGGDSATLTDRDNFRYLNLRFDGDVLVGASSLGLTQHVGVIRGLIQSRTALGKWRDKLREDPTRLMEAYLANTQTIGANA
ncbi:MAG: FAD-dependent oxidoreductase [Gammaproteobacteria bacterium]|nr:FAD-dependent oxidoreductase [Gammaproteobacteria bacterium]